MNGDDLLRELGRVARERGDPPPDAEDAAPTGLVACARDAMGGPAEPWGEDDDAVIAEEAAREARSRLVAVRGGRSAARAWVVAALALAAAALLWVAVPSGPTAAGARWEVTDLRGAAQTRGVDDGPVSIAAGQVVRFVLQPDRAIGGALEAEVALVAADGIVPIEADVEASSTGSLRVRAHLPDPLPTAPSGLRVTVRRPGAEVLQVTDLPVAP